MRRTRPVVARSTAIVFACLAVAFSQVAQAQNPNPIDVFVTWLDNETAILAFRRPAPSRRIVMGIGRPRETQLSNPSHLYRIPGLKEAIPQSDLVAFRAALEARAGDSGKYLPHLYRMEGGVPIPFDKIDQRFREYVHGVNKLAGKLEVWDVNAPLSTQPIRLVFLGDLVFVKSAVDSNPLARTEDTLVILLTNLALTENRGTRAISLEGGCVGSEANIEAVRRNPLDVQQRKNLSQTVSGDLVGSQQDEGQFGVANTGWVNRSLHLNVPSPLKSPHTVTASVNNQKEQKIEVENTDLALPPCAAAHISVEPQRWYETFSDSVVFAYKDATLKIEVPESSPRWSWIIGSGFFLLIIGLISLLVSRRFSQRLEQKRWERQLKAGVATSRTHSKTDPKHAIPLLSKLEEQSPLASLVDPPVIEPPRPPTARLDVTPLSPATEPLEKLLDKYRETNDRLQANHASALKYIEAKLSQLQSAGRTRRQLDHQKIKLDVLQAELKRWRDALKDLGDSPEAIANSWQTLNRRKQALQKRILDMHSLLAGADKNPRASVDIVRSLDDLYQSLLSTQQSKDDYEIAAMRIVEVLDPTKSAMDMLNPPERVAAGVEQLRVVTDRVVKKYAESLHVGTEGQNFSLQSVTELEKRFGDLVKTCEALAGLGADERVYRARIASRGLENVGQALRDLEREDAQYADLFVGTRMELDTLGQELLRAARSSENALAIGLAQQVRRPNGEDPQREDIDKALIPFVQCLLQNAPYMAILNMLRLQQVTEAYCRDSSDRLAATFFERSLVFREACDRVVSDFKYLGVHFHPIRFLADPAKEHLVFTSAKGIPVVQSNSKLIDPMLRKLDLDYRQYEQTVADVNAWGFECDLDPGLNCETKLWLWQPFSKT